ncbi:hypothetical protein SG34_019710 [Thalassomonas viridans]|uniref:Uncharacterized protein n=1 Tax=Thalassomonas viridans TaxID=137584 RepID=A0AAE9Z049_9GAMM|nr:hypothetical protein [Thalassomonas viridans]WDE03594.1 hypothetical protein SG34_019710 [Thalassomonas viridans]
MNKPTPKLFTDKTVLFLFFTAGIGLSIRFFYDDEPQKLSHLFLSWLALGSSSTIAFWFVEKIHDIKVDRDDKNTE